jgi:hypothetical protein
MVLMQIDTPRRARFFCAKIGHIFRVRGSASVLSFLQLWRDPRQAYPRLTDRQAQDIGLNLADLEWSRLDLPSQTTRHPML